MSDDPGRDLRELAVLLRPIIDKHYDSTLRRRRLPSWRDALLAVNTLVVAVVGAAVVLLLVRPAPTPAPYLWESPDSKVLYRCGPTVGDPVFRCTDWR